MHKKTTVNGYTKAWQRISALTLTLSCKEYNLFSKIDTFK